MSLITQLTTPLINLVGKAFKDLDVEKPLYPSIGMKKPGEHVKTNFGQQAFVFDIDGYVTVRISVVSIFRFKTLIF